MVKIPWAKIESDGATTTTATAATTIQSSPACSNNACEMTSVTPENKDQDEKGLKEDLYQIRAELPEHFKLKLAEKRSNLGHSSSNNDNPDNNCSKRWVGICK